MSIPIHRFIDPVDRSRSISTVDKDSTTGEYGRYRRSMQIHLRRITVDRWWSIKNRDNFVVDFIDDTCVELSSDPIVGSGFWREIRGKSTTAHHFVCVSDTMELLAVCHHNKPKTIQCNRFWFNMQIVNSTMKRATCVWDIEQYPVRRPAGSWYHSKWIWMVQT